MKKTAIKKSKNNSSIARIMSSRSTRWIGEWAVWVLLGVLLALAVVGMQLGTYAVLVALVLLVVATTFMRQLWRGRLVWRRTVAGVPALVLLATVCACGIAPAFFVITGVGLSHASVLVVLMFIVSFLWLGQVNLATLPSRFGVVLVFATFTIALGAQVPAVAAMISASVLNMVQSVLIPVFACSSIVLIISAWWSRHTLLTRWSLLDILTVSAVALLGIVLWYAPVSTLVTSLYGGTLLVALGLGWVFVPHLRSIVMRTVLTLVVLALPLIWHNWGRTPFVTNTSTPDTLHIVAGVLRDRPVAGYGLGLGAEVVARYHEVNPEVYALGTTYPTLPLWARVVVELGVLGTTLVLMVLGSMLLLFGYALLVVRSSLSVYSVVLPPLGVTAIALGVYGSMPATVYLGVVFLALSWWIVYNTGAFYSRVAILNLQGSSRVIRGLFVLILAVGAVFAVYQLGRATRLSIATERCIVGDSSSLLDCAHGIRSVYPVDGLWGAWYAPSLVRLERSVGALLTQGMPGATADQMLQETNAHKHALEGLLAQLPTTEVRTLQTLLLTRIASTTLDPVQLTTAQSMLTALVAAEPGAIEARFWQAQLDYRVARRETTVGVRNTKLESVLRASSDIVAKNPQWKPGQYLHAAVLLDLGRLPEAAAAASLAGAPNVEYADATELLALILIRQQGEAEVARAFEILTALTRGHPTESRYQFELAGLAEKLGKKDIAKTAYQAVLKIPNPAANPEVQVWQTRALEAIKLLDAGGSPLKQ